jgi:hypothetical protein
MFVLLYNPTVDNLRPVFWSRDSRIATAGSKFLNAGDNIHAFDDFAKNDMLAVKPASLDSSDKELGAVSAYGNQVRHILAETAKHSASWSVAMTELTCWDQH